MFDFMVLLYFKKNKNKLLYFLKPWWNGSCGRLNSERPPVWSHKKTDIPWEMHPALESAKSSMHSYQLWQPLMNKGIAKINFFFVLIYIIRRRRRRQSQFNILRYVTVLLELPQM